MPKVKPKTRISLVAPTVLAAGRVNVAAVNVSGSAAITIARPSVAETGSVGSVQNQAPVLSPITSFNIERGQSVSIASNFTDPNGDVMTFGLTSGTLPTGVTLGSNGVFTASASAALGVSGSLVVYADDGVSDAITSFNLTTTAASGTYPFTIGLGIKRGDAPVSLALDIADFQVVVKRRWNDGSVKHAIVSGHAPLVQNVAKVITVTPGALAQPGTALTSANIVAANPQASVQCGAIGIVQLQNLLASAPFRTFISGPQMVECHYHAEISLAPTQLSAWFRVRYYKNGRVWVRALCENSYLDNGAGTRGSRTIESYVPDLKVGGVSLYTNAGATLLHYPTTRYKAEGWIGGDPLITPQHDIAYLRTTKLTPWYNPSWSTPSTASFDALVQTYTPMTRGNLTLTMSEPGYQDQIGLLPKWEAMYLTTGDARAWNSLVANTFHLGGYSIVWRDFTTKLIPKPSTFSTWAADGPFEGGGYQGLSTLRWEAAHAPSEGYLLYLLGGDFDGLETMAMQTAQNWLTTDVSYGLGTARTLHKFQVRATAWVMRTVGQYVALAPTDDAVAAEYATWLNTQAVFFKSKFEAPGAAQIGIPYSWSTQHDTLPLTAALFMNMMWICVCGHLWDIEADTSAAALALRDFQYKLVVGILGPNGAENYCFTKSASGGSGMETTISDEIVQNFAVRYPTDGFYQTFGEVYEKTYGVPNTSCANTLEGSSGAFPGQPTGSWAMTMSAVSFAYDHLAPGAVASWNRLTGATNWPLLRDSGFPDFPTFGIVPRGLTV